MPRPRRKIVLIFFLLFVVGAAVAFVFWPKVPLPDLDKVPVDEAKDEQFRKLVVGTWEDDYQGKRTLTLRPDGTGTMIVELSGLNAIVASKLTFEEKWSIERGHLKMQATGGEPKSRVNMILKTMGDKTIQKILELTPSRMLLLDPNGKTEYDWRKLSRENPEAIAD